MVGGRCVGRVCWDRERERLAWRLEEVVRVRGRWGDHIVHKKAYTKYLI